MTTILTGKQHALKIKNKLKVEMQQVPAESFLAIIQTGDNQSSTVYVTMKKRFGESIGLPVQVYGQADSIQTQDELETCISELNHDDACVGIILQLPLAPQFQAKTQHYCAMVAPHKDVDGLGGVLTGLASTGLIDFLPATPAAVLTLMNAYDIDDMQGKIVTILGQSNLVGKPLAVTLMNKGATVHSFNEYSDQALMKKQCQVSGMVISCTGRVHLVNADFVTNNNSQIIIDVGYGHKNGKAVGDVDFESLVDKVQAITPVPGGVGPLTVAQLFENTLFLYENRETIHSYLG